MPPGTVIPAIIPESLKMLREHLELLDDVTSTFQIDIVDGKFVPYTSWPYKTREVPEAINAYAREYTFELDLMIEKPEASIHEWLKTSADRFVVHVESSSDLTACIEPIKDAKRKVGLAFNNDTMLDALEEHVTRIDFVQCMGISEIGRQGNGFDERVLPRIREIKERYPALEIAVDGSVNKNTIERIYEAGAIRLISGSAILESDSPVGAYNELLKRVS